jgi:hypothetical protein
MVVARRVVLSIFVMVATYVLDNGDSYSRLPSNIDQTIQLLFLRILGFVLLSMLVDTLMVAHVHITFGIWFIVYVIFRWASEKYSLRPMKHVGSLCKFEFIYALFSV